LNYGAAACIYNSICDSGDDCNRLHAEICSEPPGVAAAPPHTMAPLASAPQAPQAERRKSDTHAARHAASHYKQCRRRWGFA